jgi:hypothetical protein
MSRKLQAEGYKQQTAGINRAAWGLEACGRIQPLLSAKIAKLQAGIAA